MTQVAPGKGGSGTFDPDDEYYMEIYRNNAPDQVLRVEQHYGHGLRANESYHLVWPQSPPHEKFRSYQEVMRQGDWVRLSYCLQGNSKTFSNFFFQIFVDEPARTLQTCKAEISESCRSICLKFYVRFRIIFLYWKTTLVDLRLNRSVRQGGQW